MTLRRDRPLRRWRPDPDTPARLVCFPHAGGSAGAFFALARAVTGAEVLAVQYPGRQDRRALPPSGSVRALAAEVVDALSDEGLTDRPLMLFGHSFGALVAYEAALRIEAVRPASVLRLFASGRRAPSVYREEALRLDDDGELAAALQLLGGTAPEILANRRLLQAALPALKSDLAAVKGYRDQPGRSLLAPITSIVGDSDPLTPVDDVMSWSGHTRADFELVVVPGGHFYLDEHLTRTAQLLSRQIAIDLARRDRQHGPTSS